MPIFDGLHALRCATSSNLPNTDTLLNFLCREQIKVKVTYIVDVCLDKFGVIQQCQYECAAAGE